MSQDFFCALFLTGTVQDIWKNTFYSSVIYTKFSNFDLNLYVTAFYCTVLFYSILYCTVQHVCQNKFKKLEFVIKLIEVLFFLQYDLHQLLPDQGKGKRKASCRIDGSTNHTVLTFIIISTTTCENVYHETFPGPYSQ